MISSEIAKQSSRTSGMFNRATKKVGVLKSNPKPLSQQDSFVHQQDTLKARNLGAPASIHTISLKEGSMLPMGSNRSAAGQNGGASAKLTTRSANCRYSNPTPIEVNGQLWNLR